MSRLLHEAPPAPEESDLFERLRQALEAPRSAAASGIGPDELMQAQRRVARAERLAALGALAARVAHELGTPLHSIAGHLDLLLQAEDLPTEARERATIVAGEVDRLAALIRRQLVRLRTPETNLALENLNDLIRHVRQLMEPTCAARKIRLDLDLEPETEEPIPCDRDQIEQVLLNLLQNAIDAMPEGGVLTVRSDRAGEARAISVADTGFGIERQHLDRIFEPFFSTKALGRGTGLGLALCRDIARGHGGDLVLDSKEGLGTVVTLTLATPREADR